MKKIVKWISFWTILTLSFVLTASYLYCFANGYRINWITKKVQKTGMIIVSSSPLNARVYLDGKQRNPSPVRFSYILPGLHTVEIKMDGYQPWQQNIEVIERLAITVNAELVFEDPVIADNNEKNLIFDRSNDPQIKNSSEIWTGDKLITRFSQPVLTAVWDNDQNSIAYQVGSELRMISEDGLHDFFVTKLSSSAAIKIMFKNSTTLVYSQDGEQKQIQIRDKDSFIPTTRKFLNF